ncbi:MAG: hypothetical protein SF052_26055 [Bacteroidia bacterium]|nr:hypothetical protein [Bacteroidia bacterium]
MKQLTTDWFLEGTLDFEYKKYILLAYLQQVSREFAEVRLYPSFSELIFHYNNLHQFKENKQQLFSQFPTHISMEEFRKLRLHREPEVRDSEDLVEIDTIIDYALPAIQQRLKDGKEIYDYIDEHLNIEPIGITPLHKKEGYIMLRVNPMRTVKVYEYRISFFENTDANYHGITLNYLDSFTYSLANTYENKKLELIRHHTKMPNPATWLLYTIHPIPEEASLLPVAKRKMLAYLR